ncbi:MAG: TlpA disulfide reductase family protein [Tenuifilaceae bacterium]|nr:TlpA disulfide reductase family protein [Tenuifilaceae bacterium]
MTLRIINRIAVVCCTMVIAQTLSSCGDSSQYVRVSGSLEGAQNVVVYLRETGHNQISTVDSTQLDRKGNFELSLECDGPRFLLFQVVNESEPLVLLVDAGEKITIIGQKGVPVSQFSVNGSKGSRLVGDLNSRLNHVSQTIDTLAKNFRGSREHPKFDSIKTAIDSAYFRIIRGHKNYTENFIKENRYSLAAILALYQQYDRNTFVLNKREDFELFQLVDSALFPLYPSNPLVQNLHRNVEMIGTQLNLFDKRQDMFSEGETLPDIDLPLLNGDVVSLSDIKARYILVDFWALWCNDCQLSNSTLKEVYDRFKNKGFHVVQVSLDNNRQSLEEYINNNSIEWIVALDQKQWDSPILDAMSINSIPSNYLIDSRRIIRARNIKVKELESVLVKLLP